MDISCPLPMDDSPELKKAKLTPIIVFPPASSSVIKLLDNDKRNFMSLPNDRHLEVESDGSSLKSTSIVTNQRVLISPTDFLTLTEESTAIRNSAVKKDVNLSAGCLEIVKRSSSDNSLNLSVSLERYCESPSFLIESHRDSQMISDDDSSNNGRVSRLSETHEEMITADDLLFATTLGDQHPALREVVVTPVEGESIREAMMNKDNKPLLMDSHFQTTIKQEVLDDDDNMESNDMGLVKEETKPKLALLSPLQNPTDEVVSFSQTRVTNTVSSNSGGGSVVAPQPLTSMDIKILPTGLIQLAANLAAVFPTSSVQKQIAIQLLREDGTSIIVPITTRGNETIASPNQNCNDRPQSIPNQPNINSLPSVSGEAVQTHEIDRPFKCEMCNSTFTRLGNYTRHKKIHSLPSKEDQRFRCEICSKSFIQRCDLARHLHIHRGTEPHRCPQCGKGYIRHSDLVTHQRFHNKEKPFACPHCSKGFCQRGDLNRHLRSIHLQLKPLLCSHCHKKFAKEETLLRHINATHRDKLVDK